MTQQTAIERWQQMLEGRRDQMEAAYARLGRDNADFWARRAAQYRRYAGVADEQYPVVQQVLALLPPGGAVLDVGAGTGRLALRLAHHAGEVVAVEPQPAMAAYLTEDAAAAGITNIRLVRNGWLEAQAQIAPADVVLCAGVLFAQPAQADITAWLATLDAHARVAVVLELVVDWGEQPLLEELWQHFHGEPRIPTSTYIDVYTVLHDLGIPANVTVYDAGPENFRRYADLDEAVASVREELIVPATEEVDSTLRAALREDLKRVDDAWELPFQSRPTMTMVWWERSAPRLRGPLGADRPVSAVAF
ncbi:MAG: class I SAM-dependent methyltransferase [Dehalococcoidia bacterium]